MVILKLIRSGRHAASSGNQRRTTANLPGKVLLWFPFNVQRRLPGACTHLLQCLSRRDTSGFCRRSRNVCRTLPNHSSSSSSLVLCAFLCYSLTSGSDATSVQKPRKNLLILPPEPGEIDSRRSGYLLCSAGQLSNQQRWRCDGGFTHARSFILTPLLSICLLPAGLLGG